MTLNADLAIWKCLCPVKALIEPHQGSERAVSFVKAATTSEIPTSYHRNAISALEAFCYTVSHDLRVPLRAIRGFAQALDEDYANALDANGKDYIERIIMATERMDALIQDVLQYSRLVNSGMAFEPVDLAPIIDIVIGDLSTERRKYVFHVERPLHHAVGSKSLLHQCILNLLSNAVKFTDEGHPEVRIWTEKIGAKVRLYVHDNGIGISEEFRDKLFQPFHRASQDYEGTGVGLSIVRNAVEKMGGRVGVESQSGNGAKFWIELSAAN